MSLRPPVQVSATLALSGDREGVFFDPKSSESFTPYFSRGWRDDVIQRAYLEASYLNWGDPANNPISTIYGGQMVHVPECAA